MYVVYVCTFLCENVWGREGMWMGAWVGGCVWEVEVDVDMVAWLLHALSVTCV